MDESSLILSCLGESQVPALAVALNGVRFSGVLGTPEDPLSLFPDLG